VRHAVDTYLFQLAVFDIALGISPAENLFEDMTMIELLD